MGEKNLAKESICKWHKKDIEKNLQALIKLVNKPRFVCGNCGRSANSKKNLCKPIQIKKTKAA
jgi:hypothetical protein